ncbi:ProQ/FINO family protein [Chromatium okenii]|uniref:Fertility inhibition FinO-like protein n=1 Tax=Chromatium okenii TaxID=61644 RepID=A0A2S7XSU5_9GAMM|nr:ProQ/FinO family protein [Chromatium okenii]MBV5311154.1 ProQ/FinO family protein [Chromatium okenii]PQJ96805.1 Fertility inhibition FinO-like protein [Chromatium okenii]
MSVPNDESETQPKHTLRLDLVALYPACFDLSKPRPLKIRIYQDLREAGHTARAVNGAMYVYCNRRAYLRAMEAGAVRIDLQGQPAGEVTEVEAAAAREKWTQLNLARLRKPKRPKKIKKPKEPKPVLPVDAPLTAENIVSGRLQLTVKFDYLPKPVVVKTGMKIGIQTERALVVTTLKTKTWKKLQKAKTEWSQWIASMTGKLGAQVNSDGGIIVMLEDVVLQVFEKKVKVKVKVD